MRGSIVKRGNTYTIVLNGVDEVTGRRKQTWIAAGPNKKVAEKKLTKLLSDLDNDTFVKPTKLTLGEHLTNWLRDYVKPNLAPSTYQGREQQVRKHIAPALGRIVLSNLKPGDLQKFYASKLASGLGAHSVRDLHGHIHTALNMAVKQGLVGRNVADATDPPTFARAEMQVLDGHGLNTVLEASKPMQYYPLFYTLLFSGLRRSEVLALRWEDVNLTTGELSVTRSLHKLRTGEIIYRQPKTARSRRVLTLPQSAVLVLRQHRDNQEASRGALSDADLVFSHQDGNPYLPDSVTHVWMKLVKRCGFPGVRLHDCRHSHASLLLAAGVPLTDVSARLGHARTSITLDIYAHALPGAQQAAAAKFDDIVLRQSVTTSQT